MKVLSPESKIEILNSQYPNNGKEHLPSVKPWLMRTAEFGFKTLGPVFPNIMARQAYKIFATPRWRAKHKQPDDLILAAKTFDLSLDGHAVKIYVWENEIRSETSKIVLLAHGWESRGTALRMYVLPLLKKGYKIVAFDALGHGDSGGTRNNLLINARTVTAIYHHFGGIYAAIGHSFGCSSIVYAQKLVDNTIHIEKLIFLAVPHRTRIIMERFLGTISAPKAVQEAFFNHVERLTNSPIEASDVALAYPSVKVGKLLLIHDREDKITSIDAAERVVAHWDNAKLLITQGYGHFRIAKNPDVIRRIVEFIHKTG